MISVCSILLKLIFYVSATNTTDAHITVQPNANSLRQEETENARQRNELAQSRLAASVAQVVVSSWAFDR